jgi:hypothetical protein
MTKRKGQKDKKRSPSVPFFWSLRCLSFCPFSFGHCVACPSVIFFWPLCYLSFCPFLLVIVLLVLSFFFRRTSNTMAKEKGQKDKQHNGQKKMTEGQAT